MEIINTLSTEKKRKRYNKNKKKSWRKKVDMKDVEEGLEEKRQEERYGGPLGERESNELMFLDVGDGKKIDVDGNEEIKEKDAVVNERAPDNVLKPSKKKRSTGPLHCHKFLSGLGGAKDPKRGNRNKVNILEEKMNPITKKKVALELKSAKAQNKVKRLKATREEIQKMKLNKPKSNRLLDYSKDLWEEEKPLDTVEESFLKDCIKHRNTVTKKAKIKIPLTRDKKTSALPAIAIPLAGQSYNPRYEDHQKLMKRAIEHEEIKQDRIERPMRTTYNMFPAAGSHNTDKTWMKEMSEGLPTSQDPATPDQEQEDEDYQETKEDNDDWEDMDDDDDEEDVDNEEDVDDDDDDEDVDDEDVDDEDVEDEDEGEDEEEDLEEEENVEKENDNDQVGEENTQENATKVAAKNRNGIKRSLDENVTSSKKKKLETNNNKSDKELKKAKKETLQKLVTVSHGGTNNPKPAQQRRKEKEQKLAAEERLKEKELKQRESQVFRVKSLQKEIDVQQKKKDKRKAKREENLKNQMYKPGRMNYFRYREHDLAVALGDELADSLRSVKPKTNLMEEHFNRLQKRNMVETRIRRKVKRKPKRMIKRDQKVDYSNVDKLAKES